MKERERKKGNLSLVGEKSMFQMDRQTFKYNYRAALLLMTHKKITRTILVKIIIFAIAASYYILHLLLNCKSRFKCNTLKI